MTEYSNIFTKLCKCIDVFGNASQVDFELLVDVFDLTRESEFKSDTASMDLLLSFLTWIFVTCRTNDLSDVLSKTIELALDLSRDGLIQYQHALANILILTCRRAMFGYCVVHQLVELLQRIVLSFEDDMTEAVEILANLGDSNSYTEYTSSSQQSETLSADAIRALAVVSTRASMGCRKLAIRSLCATATRHASETHIHASIRDALTYANDLITQHGDNIGHQEARSLLHHAVSALVTLSSGSSADETPWHDASSAIRCVLNSLKTIAREGTQSARWFASAHHTGRELAARARVYKRRIQAFRQLCSNALGNATGKRQSKPLKQGDLYLLFPYGSRAMEAAATTLRRPSLRLGFTRELLSHLFQVLQRRHESNVSSVAQLPSSAIIHAISSSSPANVETLTDLICVSTFTSSNPTIREKSFEHALELLWILDIKTMAQSLSKRSSAHLEAIYSHLLSRMLSASAAMTNDPTWTARLASESPRMTEDSWKMLKHYCNTPEGVKTVADLLHLRPTSAPKALTILLEVATNTLSRQREGSHEELAQLHAVRYIRVLYESSSRPLSEKERIQEAADSILETLPLVQSAESLPPLVLPFALCASDPLRLTGLLGALTSSTHEISNVILTLMSFEQLIEHIFGVSGDVGRQFVSGLEALRDMTSENDARVVGKIHHLILKRCLTQGPGCRRAVTLLREHAQSISKTQALVPLAPVFSKESLFDVLLPRVLDQWEEFGPTTLSSLVQSIESNILPKKESPLAHELLIWLIEQAKDFTPATWFTEFILKDPKGSHEIIVALQRAKWTTTGMRCAVVASLNSPVVQRFTVGRFVPQLREANIWLKDRVLWDDVLQYIVGTWPIARDQLLLLPKTQFVASLDNQPELARLLLQDPDSLPPNMLEIVKGVVDRETS